jgi:hypothetical protein
MAGTCDCPANGRRRAYTDRFKLSAISAES